MRRTIVQLALVGFAVAVVSFAVIVINQSAQLVELAARLHPVAGTALFWFLAAFFATCLLAPLVLWLRLPGSLRPPASAEGAEFHRHVARLRARLHANPLLETVSLGSVEEIEEAIRVLDDAADELTKQAASRAFVATAVSQNGSLDALFVLGVQSRLVWDIARVYRQRPSLRDMGWLYGNVITTAFVAGEIEELDLAEQIQPVVQNALGAAAGVVPGLQIAGSVVASSIVTGTANAFLTLRVGVVARHYCGSLTRPETRRLRRAAFTEAAAMLGAIATSGAKKVVGAVARASGRTVVKTASGIGAKVKDGADTVVRTLTFRGKDGAGSGSGE